MGKDVIIACDFSSEGETLAFLDTFGSLRPYVKIGMELYYAAGPQIVQKLKERRHPVFLDLKLHDIPNTVKKAMAVLSRLDADMVNLHAAGTRAMMEAALEGLTRPDGTRPLLIAVTQLTSTSEAQMRGELFIDRPLEDVVAAYAKNAMAAGLDGVVCSAQEAPRLRRREGAGFRLVTPGIRPAGAALNDQVNALNRAFQTHGHFCPVVLCIGGLYHEVAFQPLLHSVYTIKVGE